MESDKEGQPGQSQWSFKSEDLRELLDSLDWLLIFPGVWGFLQTEACVSRMLF
jgi:hypothetical protein